MTFHRQFVESLVINEMTKGKKLPNAEGVVGRMNPSCSLTRKALALSQWKVLPFFWLTILHRKTKANRMEVVAH